MNTKTISIIGISAICAILLWFGVNWWRDNQKAALMEEIHKQKGIIQNLKEQLTKKAIEGNRLKQIADSAIASISFADTVWVSVKGDGKIEAVKRLGTDQSIEFLKSKIK